LAVTDLKRQAEAAGKLEHSFALPSHASSHRPERLETALDPARRLGLPPGFPLDTKMTEVEKACARAVRPVSPPLLAPADRAASERLQLIAPTTLSGDVLRTSPSARCGTHELAGTGHRLLRIGFTCRPRSSVAPSSTDTLSS